MVGGVLLRATIPCGSGGYMGLNRRQFFKLGVSGGAAGMLFGFDVKPAIAQSRALKISRTTQTHSICPYCSVSCGVIIHTLGDKAKNVSPEVVHVEGDPDDPINRGTLCPKGASLFNEIRNDRRLTEPMAPSGKRSPGTTLSMRSLNWLRRPETKPLSKRTPKGAPSTAAKASAGTAVAPIPTN